MFNILWIEDEFGKIEDIGPELAKIPGVSLTVLLLDVAVGKNLPNIKIIKESRRSLTIADVWKRLHDAYNLSRPWLVITDLKLDPVRNDPNVYLIGDYEAAGVNLTLLLTKYTHCRNIIWLTNYGENVLNNIEDLVISTWTGGQVKVVSFPRTFLVDKTDCGEELPQLIEYLTVKAVEKLIETKAVYRVEASRIAGLFRLLASDSLQHFFSKPARLGFEKFEEAKRSLAAYELIPYYDPPMSFSTWLRAWNPEGSELDSVAIGDEEKLARELTMVLGRHLWGMAVSELPELLIYAAREHSVSEDLLNFDNIMADISALLLAENIVIGPIARSLLICALGNSLQNAQQYKSESSEIFLTTCRTAEAIYLLIGNEVADFRKNYEDMMDKGENSRLRGIHLVNSAIDSLNQLNEAQQSGKPKAHGWGNWGYAALMWNNETKLPRAFRVGKNDFTPFSAGTLKQEVQTGKFEFIEDQLRLFENLAAKWNKSGVMSVFRLPLVRAEDLALRTPMAKKTEPTEAEKSGAEVFS
jgi:hypothetical protein